MENNLARLLVVSLEKRRSRISPILEGDGWLATTKRAGYSALIAFS